MLAPNAPQACPPPPSAAKAHLFPAAATITPCPAPRPKPSPPFPPPRSNRSAALLQLSKTGKALADAEECIRLRPDWDKGYFRKAAALEALGRMEEVGAEGGDRMCAAAVGRRGAVRAPLAIVQPL